MAKLKLTYFDFDGGRGEPARLALHIGGIEFEDHRIAGKD